MWNVGIDEFYWLLVLWDELVTQVESWKAEWAASNSSSGSDDEGPEYDEEAGFSKVSGSWAVRCGSWAARS